VVIDRSDAGEGEGVLVHAENRGPDAVEDGGEEESVDGESGEVEELGRGGSTEQQ
jgi:hypothetical protein